MKIITIYNHKRHEFFASSEIQDAISQGRSIHAINDTYKGDFLSRHPDELFLKYPINQIVYEENYSKNERYQRMSFRLIKGII